MERVEARELFHKRKLAIQSLRRGPLAGPLRPLPRMRGRAGRRPTFPPKPREV